MDREVLVAIRDLLSSNRVLALAVIVDGDPEAALLPYALREDFTGVYVQASGLARHSRGLQPDAHVGVLIHAGDNPGSDPMQLPRLTLQAAVRPLVRETDQFVTAAARFIGRFPGAKVTLNLEDFTLYELSFRRGRYVEGFARAFNLGTETLLDRRTLTRRQRHTLSTSRLPLSHRFGGPP
jgi:putative heme iron utilization protein